MSKSIGDGFSISRIFQRTVPQASVSPPPQAETTSNVGQADRLDLTSEASSKPIEADLSLSIAGRSVAPNGTVQIKRSVIDNLLQQALKGNSQLLNSKLSFDSASGAYNLSANVKAMGMQLPLSARIRLVSDQNSLGIALENVQVASIGMTYPSKLILEQMAKKVSEGNIQAQADTKTGIIRFDTTSLLRQAKVLPYSLAIDPQQTKLSLQTAASGDVTLAFQSERQGPAYTPTENSDIAVSIDQTAMTNLLREALVQDADIENVTFREGGLKIDGKAEIKDASAVLSAGKALLALMALASGSGAVNNVDPVRVKAPVSLDLDVQGTEMLITPSSSLFLDVLERMAKHAGASCQRVGDSVRVDLAAFMPQEKGTLESVEATSEGLKLNLHLNGGNLIKE